MAYIPKAVTFDCANTLLDLKWTPERSVAMCGERLRIDVSPEMGARFAEMFRANRAAYVAAGLTRDPARLRDFWLGLHASWLGAVGLSPEIAEPFVSVAEELTYGQDQVWFRPFRDVKPCLDRLRRAGIRLAVVSNWDTSLHRILGELGLAEYFEFILASLEEGMEKPDPALFLIAINRLGLRPGEVVHIGDDPVDDMAGARGAGLRALLLDRSTPNGPLTDRRPGVIRSLNELPGAIDWTG